jgi:hypothetical protein
MLTKRGLLSSCHRLFSMSNRLVTQDGTDAFACVVEPFLSSSTAADVHSIGKALVTNLIKGLISTKLDAFRGRVKQARTGSITEQSTDYAAYVPQTSSTPCARDDTRHDCG